MRSTPQESLTFKYTYEHLTALRKNSNAIQSDNIEFFHENMDSKVLAYVRWNEQGERVVVVANFSEQYLAGYRVPNFLAAGTWRDLMSRSQLEVTEDSVTIDLLEYEAKVFVYE